jgi:hypothetical protein
MEYPANPKLVINNTENSKKRFGKRLVHFPALGQFGEIWFNILHVRALKTQ